MRIRSKIVAVVLPLVIGALAVSGSSAFFTASNAVSQVTAEFLDFKTDQLEQYIEGQWRILVDNNVSDRGGMVQAAQSAIEVYAKSVLRSDTELIFAVDAKGQVVMSTAPVELSAAERVALIELPLIAQRELGELRVGSEDRVVARFEFAPFGWRVFVTETRAAFYSALDRITRRTVLFTLGAGLITAIVLFYVVSRLTHPVSQVVGAMRSIITSNDLSSQVQVYYRDEIGEMSQTFNVMIAELEKAYGRIKQYAYQAVLSQKKEFKIRNIFQKYVPQQLIDRFSEHPEAMLVGDNRELAVLFSDIRGFTSLSERMEPDVLVASLNRYFSVMVDLIMERGGVIDKYIGDAIMAFFGAPVSTENDAFASLEAAMLMLEELDGFNEQQRKADLPEFKIGVGINFGLVTVGNIGTDRKMDYTVIGDMVNVASRLEGLTKRYRQELIISEYLRERIGAAVPTRIVDSVAVKGRKAGLRIHTARRNLSDLEREAWERHNAAMEDYYQRRFDRAILGFQEVRKALPEDALATAMIERCRRYQADPPASDWNGVEVMTEK